MFLFPNCILPTLSPLFPTFLLCNLSQWPTSKWLWFCFICEWHQKRMMISGNGEGHQINCRKNNIYYSVNLELNAASFRPQYLLRKLHPFFGQWAETSIPKFCSLAVSLWRQIVSDEVSRMDKMSRMDKISRMGENERPVWNVPAVLKMDTVTISTAGGATQFYHHPAIMFHHNIPYEVCLWKVLAKVLQTLYC